MFEATCRFAISCQLVQALINVSRLIRRPVRGKGLHDSSDKAFLCILIWWRRVKITSAIHYCVGEP